MDNKINILGVELDRLTAKAAMKQMMQYMEGESVSTVEMVTLEMLMQGQDNAEWKSMMEEMDLLLPSDKTILESVGIEEGNDIRDLENNIFLRLFFRYLERNRKSVFLLAEKEEDISRLKEKVFSYRKGISIAGEAVIVSDSGKEDSVINAINGVEPDCILSVLPCPWQETFIQESRPLLNARVWFGCGPLLGQKEMQEKARGRLKYFFLKKLFRYQVERQQKDEPKMSKCL